MYMKLANGTGSISKLSGKRRKPFLVRKTIGFDLNGKQLYKVIGTYAKRTEAMQALLDYNKQPEQFERNIYTFEAVYNAFCEDKYARVNKDTPPLYTTAYKRTQNIQQMLIDKIRLADLKEIMFSAPTPATQRDVKTMLNQVFKYAIKNEFIDKNPAEHLEYQKIEKSEMHQPLTEEEIKTLWANSNDTDVRVFLIYIYTGLRPRELSLIENVNVNLNENYMIGGIKNDYSKNRMIPIADCIKPFIEAMYDPSRKYLLRPIERKLKADRPVARTTLEQWLKNVSTRLNITKHLPHDFRHTTATLLDKVDGVSLTTIQHILGQSPQTVAGKIYIHKTLIDMLEAVNKLPHY